MEILIVLLVIAVIFCMWTNYFLWRKIEILEKIEDLQEEYNQETEKEFCIIADRLHKLEFPCD